MVRVGAFAQIGQFSSEVRLELSSGDRVICRTARGLEVGIYLESIARDIGGDQDLMDGVVLRKMTVQDDLLQQRLDKNRQLAIADCQQLVGQIEPDAVLLDAEQTFDGQRLYFYFLGDVSPELERLTDDLAEKYDAKVRFSEFAETLSAGCGPDCGTETAAGGCGTAGGCSSCGVKGACGTTKS